MTMQLLGGVFGIVGVLAMIAGSVTARKTKRFLARASTARGTVVHLVMRSSTDSADGTVSYAYHPIIKFTAQTGEDIEFESSSGSNPPMYALGQPVEILYDPQDPYRAKIHSFFDLWLATAIMLGIGGIFAIVGFGLVLFQRG
ncbi:MAG: DUF3592 domain-containing protein [Leptolyngbyaceae cyanobacterium bins.349]|nr:DUF3592 domain-containing protein [Leptolyngbyaceae cyanobacterium bins.349]